MTDRTTPLPSDEERCWHGRFLADSSEWCKERGYPPKVLLGNATDNWLWCGAHGPRAATGEK